MAKIIDLDMDRLAMLMRYKPTLADTAAFFGVSEDTVERRIREATQTEAQPKGQTFAEFRDQKMAHTRMSLIQKALVRAEKSDTMLIFCLKNMCDWGDKRPGEDTNNVQVNVANVGLTRDEREAMIRTARAELVGTIEPTIDHLSTGIDPESENK